MIIVSKSDFIEYNSLKIIIETLHKGGIIVYPTETAYGIGCDAYNKEAIIKIFEIKKRPFNQPLPIIVDSLEMAEENATLNFQAKKLSEKFHPGPLILAVPKTELILDILNKNGIAFRISDNRIVQEIISYLKKPLVSTSANITGHPTPYSIKDVLTQLNQDKIDIIIDRGSLPLKKPSTIVDFQLEPIPQIIRVGEISAAEIFTALGIKKEKWSDHLKYL